MTGLLSKISLVFLCSALLFPTPAPAAPETEPIKGIALVDGPDSLTPGREAAVRLIIGVNPGYKINAHKPSVDWISPTVLEFDPNPDLKVVAVNYPTPTAKKFPFADKELLIYEKMVSVGLTVAVADRAGPGPAKLTGRLKYQACTEKMCLPPAEMKFDLTVAVGPAPAPGAAGLSPAAPKPEISRGPPQPGRASADKARSTGGLLLLLISTFIGGLALNLTPCVYPLVPITVAYFAGQSQGRGGLIGHGLAYLIGLMATYTALGASAALSGRLMGSILQHPATLLGVSAVLLWLAGSMFGLYEFRLPGFLTRLGNVGAGRRGYTGSLLMGLTLGLVAAPCLGPFTLGALTMVAQSGETYFGALVFGALSFGLGLPIVILGLFSSRLTDRLPSSGMWMNWVKILLGMVLVIMVVYLLRPLLGEGPWTTTMVVLIAAASVGAVALGANVKLWPRLVVAGAGMIAAIWIGLSGLTGPPDNTWQYFQPAHMEEALKNGRPVVLDFYADWCAPCRELARTMAKPEVVALLKQTAAFKVDLTDWKAASAEKLRREYDVKGVPTVVFILPSGREVDRIRVVGAEPGEKIVQKLKMFLAMARQ